jgi:hypothetical protein
MNSEMTPPKGEYRRAHLGMSPLKYRKELLRNKV